MSLSALHGATLTGAAVFPSILSATSAFGISDSAGSILGESRSESEYVPPVGVCCFAMGGGGSSEGVKHARLTPLEAKATFEIPEELSTVTDHNTIVPWLAAKGKFSFEPLIPPRDDRYLDYYSVMPDIFTQPGVYPLGSTTNPSVAAAAHVFWDLARLGKVKCLSQGQGRRTVEGFAAPMAVFEWVFAESVVYYLIQNGSYQELSPHEHPEVREGRIRLINDGDISYPSERNELVRSVGDDIWDAYLNFVVRTFISSQDAFAYALLTRTPNLIASRRPYIIEHEYKKYLGDEALAQGVKKLSRHHVNLTAHYHPYPITAPLKPGVIETDLSNMRISTSVQSNEYYLVDARKIDILK